jgi:hypothetical protein
MELMSLPNYSHFTKEFAADADLLYEVKGYSEETMINNMIIQLLIMGDYIDMDDLSSGRIPEKVNRETIAAAKYAVMKKLGKIGGHQSDYQNPTSSSETTDNKTTKKGKGKDK